MGIESTKCCNFSYNEEKKFEHIGTRETNIKQSKLYSFNQRKFSRNLGLDSKKTTFTSRKDNLIHIIKKYEPPDPMININEDFFMNKNDILKIIKIQSVFRSHISRRNYNTNLKSILLKNQIELFNELYENYMKYNTKLAESLIGYKLDKTKIKKREKEKNLKTYILIYSHDHIKNFYSGEVNINNNRNGYGIRLFNDGTKYEGEWEKNDFTGY